MCDLQKSFYIRITIELKQTNKRKEKQKLSFQKRKRAIEHTFVDNMGGS